MREARCGGTTGLPHLPRRRSLRQGLVEETLVLECVHRLPVPVVRQGNELLIVDQSLERLDDQLFGQITGIDIFRVLPFGGSIVDVEIKGNLLKGVLEYGKKHTGTGAFLQLTQISFTDEIWKIAGKPILDNEIYKIVISDFLLKGYDIPFLKSDNPAIIRVDKPKDSSDPRYDIRAAIISYLTE